MESENELFKLYLKMTIANIIERMKNNIKEINVIINIVKDSKSQIAVLKHYSEYTEIFNKLELLTKDIVKINELVQKFSDTKALRDYFEYLSCLLVAFKEQELEIKESILSIPSLKPLIKITNY